MVCPFRMMLEKSNSLAVLLVLLPMALRGQTSTLHDLPLSPDRIRALIREVTTQGENANGG